jgi:hypothetical protein
MDIAQKTSSLAINKAIGLVKTGFASAGDRVHAAMILIVEHAMAYGDCTGAARLVDAMPKSSRRSLVINHFADYSPILVKKVKDSELMNATLGGKNKDGTAKVFNLDGLKANRWDQRPEVQKEPDMITLDSAKDAVYKLLQSLENKGKKANDNDVIQYVKSTRAKIAAGLAA